MENIGFHLSGVTKRHGSAVVISNLSGAINANAVTVLSGPSGCGKTTLLHLLAALERPDEGTLSWRGKLLPDDADTAARFRRHCYGIAFQRSYLLAELSLLENIALPLRMRGCSKKRAHSESLVLLSQLGLKQRAEERPHVLSGGERQRGSLCRAIIAAPDILLLDEPTAHLDAASIDSVLDIIIGRRPAGQTVIVATHDSRVVSRGDVVIDLTAA